MPRAVVSAERTSSSGRPIENTFAVVVNPGDAFVKGRSYKSDSDKQFTLSSGNGEQRIGYNVATLNSTIANLVVQNQRLRERLDNERKYDTVVKDGNVYLQTRPYDSTIDADFP